MLPDLCEAKNADGRGCIGADKILWILRRCAPQNDAAFFGEDWHSDRSLLQEDSARRDKSFGVLIAAQKKMTWRMRRKASRNALEFVVCFEQRSGDGLDVCRAARFERDVNDGIA